MKRLLAIGAAIFIACTAFIAHAATADAASRSGVGQIYLHAWTKPYHQYLRTAVFTLPANAGACDCWGNRPYVQYRISRHTSSGWRVVKSRTADVDWFGTDRVTGYLKDVETWYAWEFKHAGRYRWQATLHAHGGTVSTDARTFRVYYR